MGPGSTVGTTVISEACLEGSRGEHLPDLGIGSDFSNQSQKVSTIRKTRTNGILLRLKTQFIKGIDSDMEVKPWTEQKICPTHMITNGLTPSQC